jgi:lysophospholipase L1-like esterase
MIIETNSKLVMIGDSITDCERSRPIGEGPKEQLGNGYVNLISGLLGSEYPEKRIRIVNVGSSGDTVRRMSSRWQEDVLDLKPDWLSIMIGINDVWRQFDSPLRTEAHVYIDEYRNTLENLIKITLPGIKGMVLMTPYFIEPDKNEPMRFVMDEYGEVVKELALKYGTVFVDTQAEFDSFLKQYHSSSIAWDRVHPNTIGHMLIARAFLKAIGFSRFF